MSKPTNCQILKTVVKARKVIAKKKHWVVGDEAETKEGYSVNPNDKNAYAFCAIGSVHKVVGTNKGKLYKKTIKALNEVVEKLYPKYNDVVELNDESESHKKVLKIFDNTIDRLANK